jgi:hypothetical protein
MDQVEETQEETQEEELPNAVILIKIYNNRVEAQATLPMDQTPNLPEIIREVGQGMIDERDSQAQLEA